MRRRGLPALMIFPWILPLAGATTPHRALSFEQRVRAQEAIERVYYSHLTGATRPFEDAVPREVLERKVRTYLQQSVALEQRWRAPITGEALRHEMDRMARGSRFPDRLREIYAALGSDPFVIEETFARASLADRLSRGFFAYDQRIHEAARDEAQALHSRLVRGEVDAAAEDAHRSISAIVQTADSVPRLEQAAPEVEEVSAARFAQLRSQAPRYVGEIGALTEERDTIVFRVVLDEAPGRMRVASYAVVKKPWEEWWQEASGEFDMSRFRATTSRDALSSVSWLAPSTAISRVTGLSCVADDTWDNGTLDDLPDIRSAHTAVWTGSHMIIWGGTGPQGRLATGSRYDPLTDSWAPTSMAGAPEPRANHTAIWTGDRMIVWGGFAPISGVNTGGLYDPIEDLWTPTSTSWVPAGRGSHTAVWTGSEMIVWGGLDDPGFPNYFVAGGRYDPASDIWRPASQANAPSGRVEHSAIWTGGEMIVWGGRSNVGSTETGARYDPLSDLWVPTSTPATLPARRIHAAVWTGAEMIVWGGVAAIPFFGEAVSRDGFRYDPASDRWTPTSTTNSPSPRNRHSAVWSGSRMIVWGGTPQVTGVMLPPTALNDGRSYDPLTDTWSAIAGVNPLQASYSHTVVWTGSAMIVWGGIGENSGTRNGGGRYDPATDSWTPTLDSYGGPDGPVTYEPVWTGNELLLWSRGWLSNTGSPYSLGARYNVTTDSWTPITTTDEPSPRLQHAVAWTGHEMFVWGGRLAGAPGLLNDGGRYDPIADTWSAISIVGAPSGRVDAKAIWAGHDVIVWGGVDTTANLSSGGRYDPATDTWQPMSAAGAPAPAQAPSAIWTGQEMIVWGGQFAPPPGTPGEGGRYDPLTDTWSLTSTVNAPSERLKHSAVWTGNQMIVYGGQRSSSFNAFGDGGFYDPSTDIWTRFFTGDFLLQRTEHSAVWTGSRMVIWGGFVKDQFGPTSQGGAYDPATDTWTPTSMVGVPTPRYRHAAVWTGSRMLIWGGISPGSNRGGRYALGQSSDDDLDGSSECAGDCDDTDPSTYAGAPQACGDVMNNDCLDAAWPSLAGTNESDDDGDAYDECQGDCNDSSAAVNPGRIEVCNGIDDDCDGRLPNGEADGDGDGYRGCENDCNDDNPAVQPAATDLPGNAADENCDGTLTCDPSAYYKTHGMFVRCVVQECGRLVSGGQVGQAQCDTIISNAVHSSVGRRSRLRPPPIPSAP